MSKKLLDPIELLLRTILEKLFKRTIPQEKNDAIMQFIKFGVVGLSNTVISYVVYIVVLLGLQYGGVLSSIDYLIAQFMGFILSVMWSFYWNNKYVFRDDEGQRNILQALLKTYMSYAFTGLFLNSILSFIWVEMFNWSKMIAPIINLLVSVPINFIINKFWAFK